MANNPSAIKRIRQDEKRRNRNRTKLSSLRRAVKSVRAAVADGDFDAAAERLPQALTLIDRSAQAGVIHHNAANRKKSRLTRLVQSRPAS